MRHLRFAGILVAVGLALGLGFGRSSAHGGGTPQLVNEPVGPYSLSAWTNPDPATIGQLHITVGLALASTGAAVTEPQVRVSATPEDGSTPALQAEASHEGALTPVFYETDLSFPTAGAWQIDLIVQGDEGGGGVSFILDVRESAPNYVLFGGIGVVVVVLIWLGFTLLRGRKTPTST